MGDPRDRRRGAARPGGWRSRGGITVLGLLLGVGAACGSAAGDPGQDDRAQVSDSVVNERLFDCLSQAGFAVTRGPAGEITFVDPEDEQFSAYEAAHERCRQQLVADGLLPELDEELIRQEYRQLRALQACLAANGFATGSFPSEDTYVERRDEFTNLFALNTEAEWERARQACPEEMAEFEGAPGG
jgi:hypothetical protein